MIIGIEGQRLFRQKKHGMDMVALELIRNLQKIDRENEYVVFIKPDTDDKVLTESENLRIVKLKGGFYPLWEQFALPRAAKKAGCQVLHCTSNTAPIFTGIPLVVTLHDIIYMESSLFKILRGSGTLYQKFGNLYRRLVVPRIIKKSLKVITVSYFEKKRIGDFFRFKKSDRLTAVYNGFSSHFRPVNDKIELHRVREKYNLPDRYFFFLGNTDPKKNTKGTLKAYSEFVKQRGTAIKLVMIDYDQAELEKLLAEIGDPSLISQILLTGYVVNTDLPSIYSQSEAFLYPSLRESFGIPMLEAMACGTPVVTSNTSSMPEVAGEAAIIINPFNPSEITSALCRLQDEPRLNHELKFKGFAQASKFSWEAMAHQVLKIYNEI